MIKIDNAYLLSAKIIREEFLEVTDKLSMYERESKELGEYLIKVSDELKTYSAKSEKLKTTTIEDIQKHVLNIFSDIESECNRITMKTETLNKKMEELRKNENKLHDEIVTRYGEENMPDIIKQITEYVSK